MDAPVVDVRALRKVYRVTERETGLAATFGSFVKRRYREVWHWGLRSSTGASA